MLGRNGAPIKRAIGTLISISLLLIGLAACGNSPNTGNKATIKIGVSLSLSGDFSADGQAMLQGYELWAADVNAHGGLLGRKVTLDILSDASSESQVAKNYQKLINVDHCDLLFGPYSTLLTKPASVVAQSYGYALVEGAGGGPSVFNRGLNNVFDVSLPVANNLVTFTRWMLSLPSAQRPKTAAYATEDDPFTQPQVDLARQLLEQGGVHTAFYTVYPADTTDYAPIAQKIIVSRADIAIFGTMLPDISSFIQAFKQAHYSPKALIATAGPDQGIQFLQAIGGVAAAEGILVPNSWFAQENTPGNAQMVQEYIAKFGGTPDAISSDVAEAYSVGQVIQQAVIKTGGFDQATLIRELHSDTFTTVQGPVSFDGTGQNVVIQSYIFQWQQGTLVPIFPAGIGSASPEYPKSIVP